MTEHTEAENLLHDSSYQLLSVCCVPGIVLGTSVFTLIRIKIQNYRKL